MNDIIKKLTVFLVQEQNCYHVSDEMIKDAKQAVAEIERRIKKLEA